MKSKSTAALIVVGLVVLAVAPTRAENVVTIRGAYYREPSTRVIQPVVEIAKDLPHGIEVRASYLLDAITSASVAAGTLTGDNIFTEVRNEVGLQVSKRWAQTQASVGYHYSAESDYWAHTVNGAFAQHLWGDTGLLAVSAGLGFDSMSSRGRTPSCAKPGELDCYLRSYFGGLSYTQVITPQFIAQGSADLGYLDGFQANLYRSVPNHGYEAVPSQRTRLALAPRVAYYFPSTGTGLQVHYRYYRDSWSVDSHTVEGRVYQTLTDDLELRLSLRYYHQTPADFWCDWMAHPDCYAPTAQYYPGDPKLAPVHTLMPEIKFAWEAYRLRGVPFFGWFAAGTFEISYARYFQSSASLGNAHLLQAGYSMPY
ncbi:MAG TPA: DUF3570 domain-containing protein [Polyangia bacterium]